MPARGDVEGIGESGDCRAASGEKKTGRGLLLVAMRDVILRELQFGGDGFEGAFENSADTRGHGREAVEITGGGSDVPQNVFGDVVRNAQFSLQGCFHGGGADGGDRAVEQHFTVLEDDQSCAVGADVDEGLELIIGGKNFTDERCDCGDL